MTLLHLNEVSCRYGAVTAVDHLTLNIAAGARHAVIGPNGAGKSSLLSLIAGSTPAATRTITFHDQTITRMPANARARQGITRTFQHPAVAGQLTAAENVALAVTGPTPHRGWPRRTRLKSALAEAEQALDQAGLIRHAHTAAAALPYGVRRRLELTMALTNRPRLLLLDEPSAGLDPDEIATLTATIRALPDEVTVLIVDHRLELIWELADTVTVLNHGQHLTTGTPDTVRADPAVQSAYLSPTTGVTPPRPPQQRTTAQPALLRVRGLSAGYDGAPVLHDITLDVTTADVVAVLGRNGAGKTTLLNTLAGLHPLTGGSVELDGAPLPRQAHRIARAGAALVPQGRRLFSGLTVAEHLPVADTASRRRADRRWTRDRVLSVLPSLQTLLHRDATRLSGGEQQMLAIARALLAQPKLLLLDEPTEGLAPGVITRLAEVIARIADDGVTVLLAEQNVPLARTVADRLIVLDRGRIAFTTTPDELSDPLRQRRLEDLLGVTTARQQA